MQLQPFATETHVDEALRLFQVSTLDAAMSGSLAGKNDWIVVYATVSLIDIFVIRRGRVYFGGRSRGHFAHRKTAEATICYWIASVRKQHCTRLYSTGIWLTVTQMNAWCTKSFLFLEISGTRGFQSDSLYDSPRRIAASHAAQDVVPHQMKLLITSHFTHYLEWCANLWKSERYIGEFSMIPHFKLQYMSKIHHFEIIYLQVMRL